MTENAVVVWLRLPNGTFYPMKAGMTKLRERVATTLLETPNVNSPLRKREVLSHTAQLEFEGQRDRSDPVCEYLHGRYLKRGNDVLVTFIVYDEADKLTGNAYLAHQQQGYICIEDPGSGTGILGSRIKGRIVYATAPQEGAFNVVLKRFTPY